MKQFTERDKEIYKYIRRYSAEHGFSPSVREIGSAVYMSRSAVQRHLYKLQELGYISITPKIPRSIVILLTVD